MRVQLALLPDNTKELVSVLLVNVHGVFAHTPAHSHNPETCMTLPVFVNLPGCE